MVHGDEQLLRIAIASLLEDAFEFTGNTTNARIEVSRARVGQNLSVRVRDTAPGSTPTTPIDCFVLSSACTPRASTRAPASVSVQRGL